MVGREGEREGMQRLFFFIIILFTSFSDLQKLNHRFLSVLKAKLIHAARATRGYQNLGVS